MQIGVKMRLRAFSSLIGQGQLITMHMIANIYYDMATKRLRDLRSKKAVRVAKLESEKLTYFSQQEMRKLRQQIIWIDAVIAARTAQESLF